jgi:uncharacterized protein (TIGR03067 family)
MHWHLLTVVLVVAAPAPPEKEKKDEEKIQGTWVVVSAEEGGRVDADKAKDVKLVFDGETVIVKDPRRDEKAKIKLDPAKKPKTIDITPEEKGAPAKVIQGIYELNGDELKLCFTKEGGTRPTEFASKPGGDVSLIVLKREKKEK